jgi:hypothetical protein
MARNIKRNGPAGSSRLLEMLQNEAKAFPPHAAARRGEWNDLAAVLDWLGIAELSCHQINPYVAGWRADPAAWPLDLRFDIKNPPSVSSEEG